MKLAKVLNARFSKNHELVKNIQTCGLIINYSFFMNFKPLFLCFLRIQVDTKYFFSLVFLHFSLIFLVVSYCLTFNCVSLYFEINFNEILLSNIIGLTRCKSVYCLLRANDDLYYFVAICTYLTTLLIIFTSIKLWHLMHLNLKLHK